MKPGFSSNWCGMNRALGPGHTRPLHSKTTRKNALLTHEDLPKNRVDGEVQFCSLKGQCDAVMPITGSKVQDALFKANRIIKAIA
jgi:hypothetical protein